MFDEIADDTSFFENTGEPNSTAHAALETMLSVVESSSRIASLETSIAFFIGLLSLIDIEIVSSF